MHIVKSVGVMSVAKIMGLLYGCLGLVFVPFFLLVGLMRAFAGQDKAPLAGAVGVVFAVLMPLVYGGMGFVFGALGALLYNVLARWVGGFEVELDVQPKGPVAPYPIIPAPSSNI
jgi:hypothetical protein